MPIFTRSRRGGSGLSGSRKARFGIALVIVVFAVISFYSRTTENPITGQKQRVALSVQEEIALGLHSAPEMAKMHGGLDPSRRDQARVDAIGEKLLIASFAGTKIPYEFDFHLLSDSKVVNAFALPGGQVFVTRALYDQLNTDGLLAGVVGHEIGHVIERHGAEHMAKQEFTQGLVGAAVIAATDPNSAGSARTNQQIAQMVGSVINMKYGRSDEIESDRWGVKLMSKAGYDPRQMIRVMEILEASGGGAAPAEFLSTHPSPDNRIEKIEGFISEEFPGGVPAGMEK